MDRSLPPVPEPGAFSSIDLNRRAFHHFPPLARPVFRLKPETTEARFGSCRTSQSSGFYG